MFVKVVDILHYSCNMIRYYDDFCINIKSTCNNWLKFETYTDNRIQMQILRAKLQENMYLLLYQILLLTLTPVLMPVLYTGEDFLSRVFEKLSGTESAFIIEDHWLHTHGELLSLYQTCFVARQIFGQPLTASTDGVFRDHYSRVST